MGIIKEIQTDIEMGAVRLFSEYYTRLFADARELYKDDGLAEDAVMSTLERFISCREKYDPAKGELYPWLKTLMRNSFISSKRVRKNTDTVYVSPEELKILSDSQAEPLNIDEKKFATMKKKSSLSRRLTRFRPSCARRSCSIISTISPWRTLRVI